MSHLSRRVDVTVIEENSNSEIDDIEVLEVQSEAMNYDYDVLGLRAGEQSSCFNAFRQVVDHLIESED